MNRSNDFSYSWSTRWQRDLASLEKGLNETLPPSRFAPTEEGDIRSYGRGAGALVLLKLVQDYMELEIQKREFDVKARIGDIVAQVHDQLQPGQQVQVHIAINIAQEIRVNTLDIEPLRNYPQLRASNSQPQLVWSESSHNSSANGSETVTIQVRKAFSFENEQCLVQEVSSPKSVTTKFRISERNETLEVRHLQMPAGSVASDEVAKVALEPLRLSERPLYEAERKALEEHFTSALAKARAESEAIRETERKERDNISMPPIENRLH